MDSSSGVAIRDPGEAVEADEFFQVLFRGSERFFGFKNMFLRQDAERAVSGKGEKFGCEPDVEV